TEQFHINWPAGAKVRVLEDCISEAEKEVDQSDVQTVTATDAGRPILLWSTDSPLRSTSGRLDKMPLYCGNGVDKINVIKGAADRIEQIVREAEELCGGISDLPDIPEISSSVCYAGELFGAYMGQMERNELISMFDDAY